MDEIYALSQMKRFTSIEKEQPFVSIAKIRPDLGNYVHFVWGFSKDLAMSGARVGFLISKNKGVIDAIRCFTYWFEVSGITQRVLSALVSDAAFCQRYINELSERLTSSRDATIQCLESYSIPYFKVSLT